MNCRFVSRLALGFGLAAVLAVGIWLLSIDGETPRPEDRSRANEVLRAHASPVELPDLAFYDGAGARRSLAEFRGRHVLLNIWATWCVPCREEMPALSRLQRKLGSPQFEVLALSIDSGGAEAVKRFYGEVGVDALAIYVDPSMQASAAVRTVGVPTTLLIDPEGREIARHVGPAEWDSAEAAQSIRRLMATATRQ